MGAAVFLSIMLGIGIGLLISVVIDIFVRRNVEKEIGELQGELKMFVRKVGQGEEVVGFGKKSSDKLRRSAELDWPETDN